MIRGKDNDRNDVFPPHSLLQKVRLVRTFFVFYKKKSEQPRCLTVTGKTPIFSFRDKETGEAGSGRIHCFERSEEEGKV
ncbi:MAG TPA: hypothetical protein DEF35_21415 [Paenibacillus sp.]|nr:hypothetical protein CA599_17005 [Paenibacillus taichungensis]HBU84178.1 hypothetical protein [Paenibacillus sp.]